MYSFNTNSAPLPANKDTEILNINIPDLKIFYTASVKFSGLLLPVLDVYGSDYVIGCTAFTSGTNVVIKVRPSAQWTMSYPVSGVIFYN